ncbi:MAG: hypothetical protein MJ082_05895 [Clostridia bacterium]|nr:hypothetical protein [Clostridia bacterium]
MVETHKKGEYAVLFHKPEKKKFRPFLTLTVATLCTVGACSIGATVKRKMSRVGECVKKLCRPKGKEVCPCEDN